MSNTSARVKVSIELSAGQARTLTAMCKRFHGDHSQLFFSEDADTEDNRVLLLEGIDTLRVALIKAQR